MKKLLIAFGVSSIAILFSCKKDLKENPTSGDTRVAANLERAAGLASDSAEHVPNQLLVRFVKGTPQAGRENVLSRIAGKVQEHIVTKAMQRFGDNEGFYIVYTPLNALEAIGKVKGGTELEYAGLNYIHTHFETSNDTYYTGGNLWGMYSDDSPTAGPSKTTNQFGSQAEKAWSAGKIGSESVYIGVIDEGVMHTHNDLSPNVDNTNGWDFNGNDATTYDGPNDDHGTHVAGTIGAVGGNARGVAGVCWNVKMIPAKFLGARGGSTADAIKAIDFLTQKKLDGLNIIATNNSWGGGGYSKELELAIGRAGDAGILFVCAAGNDGKNIDQSGSHVFPACYYNWNIITVAALTSAGAKASYSNYGQVGLNDALGTDKNHSFVDIAAPGSGINSTVPSKSGTSSYASYNGTSMATPHVTGAIALYAAANNIQNLSDPVLAQEQAKNIKHVVLNSAILTGSFDGRCVTGGRLDVHSAWQKLTISNRYNNPVY